jgi:membrane associated rhomboid family serine protease
MNAFPYKELKKIVLLPTLLVGLCWGVFSINYFFKLDLFQFGISPRKINGLIGILVAPILHVEFNHILNNTLPLFVLSTMLFYFYKPIAWPVFFWIYVISGIWLWVGGGNNDVIPFYHFGASILIYGFSTFLFFSGVFRKQKQLMVVSSIVVFLYGSITWGIFPVDESVSWEGHLFGALSGVLVAYFYKKDGPQQIEYHWPDDDETDIDYMQTDEIIPQEDNIIDQENLPNTNPFPVHYVYHFKEKEKQ